MGDGRPKNSVIAGVLSGIIPGLGQFYCRQWGKGTIFLIGALAIDSLFGLSANMLNVLRSFGSSPQPVDLETFLIGSILFLAVAIWSVVDAVRSAKRSRQ